MADLHMEYQTRSCPEHGRCDQDILEYIKKFPAEQYDQVLGQDDRWEVFYQLSPMRTSLLQWYPFEEGKELLEIGAGMGALTGMFCQKVSHVVSVERSALRAEAVMERCGNYENLDVYLADFRDIRLEQKFDYVVAVGILESQDIRTKRLEDYAGVLKCMKGFLKADGKLLLAVENRIGLRYLCGAVDGKTKHAFDSVNGYACREGCYSFTKAELEKILDISGLTKHKFYYPLPDYKFTQAVYAEQKLPVTSVRDRVIPCYERKDTLLVSELELMDTVIENGILDVMANSFLVECSDFKDFCHVEHAVLTADRGRERSLATIVMDDGVVRKCALYEEGRDHLKKMTGYMEDMQKHGIKTVLHKRNKNGEIEMPFIHAPLLLDVLKDAAEHDVQQLLYVLDQLEQQIQKSSDAVECDKNAFLPKYAGDYDWGIILKRAYVDMVPMNCFYQEGEILFFDQEFVRENLPARYIMFRALLYTYSFAAHVESVCPISRLRERYGISKQLWDVFFAEELEFVSKARRHDIYRYFHEWTQVDPGILDRRAAGLAEISVV